MTRPTPRPGLALAGAVLLPAGCSAGSDPSAAPSATGPTALTAGSLPAASGKPSASPVVDQTGQAGPVLTPVGAPTPLDLAALEAELGARIGVYAIDTGDGATVEHRPDERFAYASTIKALAAGAILAQTTPEDLARVVSFTAGDLVPYSPVTEQSVGAGLTLGELAAAAVQVSDNTAANLLLAELGGPEGLEQHLRNLGDTTTQVDRVEPDLNEAAPGDSRDTSTPRAMASSLAAYALGDALDGADRAQLLTWLEGSTTGDALVRAGAPSGWEVADKSGTGGFGTRNDIAVVRPPDRAPVVIAVMTSRGSDDEPSDDAVARAAAVALDALGG